MVSALSVYSQVLRDGLYLDIEGLRNNNPIPLTYLINELDIRKTDYLDEVVKLDSIRYYDQLEQERVIVPIDLWGYCKNGNPYIWFDGQFARVQVVGSICHFTSIIEVRTYVAEPFNRMGMEREIITQELVSNMIVINTGKVGRFTTQELELVLQQDPVLTREFLQIKKKEREKMLFRFMLRYNERHPFRFGE